MGCWLRLQVSRLLSMTHRAKASLVTARQGDEARLTGV